MKLSIGTRVRWESAAGFMRGTIKNIVISPAANDTMTPWIDIEVDSNTVVAQFMTSCSVRLCASDDNLTMMNVTPIVAN